MTEIVTVSATTAAYATEPLKASARISGSAPAQESMHAVAREARNADTASHQASMQKVGHAALTLFFLNAGEHRRYLQQATFQQAEDAYFSDIEEMEEAEARMADEAGEEPDDSAGQPAEDDLLASFMGGDEPQFPDIGGEILALPAPAHG